MRIRKLGVNKEANIILGAGASRGASCFKELWAQSPLDGDFFDQVDRLKCLPEGKVLESLAEFARNEFGIPNTLFMESFFTQLESLNEFYTKLNVDPGPRVRAYQKQLEKFPTYLAAIFRSLRSLSGQPVLQCNFHRRLASGLHSGDSIISFNYDCIIDEALKRESGKSWHADNGYAVHVRGGADRWHDHSGRGRIANNSIKLLKVHGSLNWRRDEGANQVALREDPYEKQGRGEGEVVPPVWDKSISGDPVISDVWKAARNALRKGPVLVVVGYSVPETDLLSQVLFRVATSEGGKGLTHLISVNPDRRAHRKIREVLRHALTPKSTVIELGSWEELCQLI